MFLWTLIASWVSSDKRKHLKKHSKSIHIFKKIGKNNEKTFSLKILFKVNKIGWYISKYKIKAGEGSYGKISHRE